MTKQWIPAIYDRTYGSVQAVQYNPNQENPKGCWNASDLNRIENDVSYCAEYMLEMKIVHTAPAIRVSSFGEWTNDMIPAQSEISRILGNVRLLVELSRNNPAIADKLPNIYLATQINYVLANQIEFALDLMHNQPKLPLEYWNVSIEHGIITTVVRDGGTTEIVNSSTALVAEDEIVTIRGVEYGEDAQYQDFTYWSGEAADIDLLDDNESQETSFTMPYRDIEFTANFETHIPRTLTIVNGYISENGDPTAESGPSTKTYLAGSQIMVIANIAPYEYAFYEWTGTQEGLDNLRGATYAEDPSTAILTMPDCDVTLTAHYINAGRHYVTVNGGSGSGWYNYGEYVSISADVPYHNGFDSWSGNTSYLEDIHSSYQSFRMGDSNISFTAHWSYRPSFNSVQIINGLISGETQVNGYENSVIQLTPTPPDASQGLQSWTIEGYGSVSGNTFTIGDGNAIITGNYAPIRTITVRNINNSGGTNTYQIVQGLSTGDIWTASSQGGNYKFDGWYENNVKISGNRWINISAGENNRDIEARYNYYPNHTVTIINRDNSGTTSTATIVEGELFSTSTNEEQGDYLFNGWSGDKSSGSTYIEFRVYADTTITANYRQKETYHLTVNSGSGSGDYKERQWVNITADAPSAGASFTGWSTSDLRNINNSYASSTTIQMGRSNATCTATYSNLRNIQVTTESGTSNYNIVEGNKQWIQANPAPSTWEFNEWQVTAGDATFDNYKAPNTYVYAHTQNSEIAAYYTPIPYFTVTMRNGYIYDNGEWVTSATILRDSTNQIKMKPAPLGKQFLQWNVYENEVLQTDANDVMAPLAENTNLRGLQRNITIEAEYFKPDQETEYTLTIERKDGTSSFYNSPAGRDVNISASYPDQGMEFYKWTGDTTYIAGGIYNENSYVHMPTQNIRIKENFVPEGYIPEFDLVMNTLYAECCYETEYTDPETGEITITENWTTRHSYPEGTIVKIRSTGFDDAYYFDTWTAYNHDTEADARSIITSLSSANTTLQMPDYDVDVEPRISLKQTYRLEITDGRTSGNYYKDYRANVYFYINHDEEDVHYNFKRWVNGPGTQIDISQLKLFDGGMFNVLVPGDESTPQYIRMPDKRVEIAATYDTLYRISLTNGIIDNTSTNKGYYVAGTTLNITANPAPSGMRFQYWAGDTSRIGSIYDPTTTIITASGVTNIRAVYSTDAERNSIGITTLDLKNTNIIDNNDIDVISGNIEVGFILTDINGHIYIVTNVDQLNNTSTILRMTKIVEGGNVYG